MNDTLPVWHSINLFILITLSITTSLLLDKQVYYAELSRDRSLTDEKEHNTLMKLKYHMAFSSFKITYDLFNTYVTIFLLWLITKFARESVDAETKDGILDKKVPNLVFIMNHRLLK